MRYSKPGEWIVVGLGNPGQKYSRHRHNLGFMVLDALAEEARGIWIRSRELAFVCRLTLENQDILLIKPQTYMNLSGRAVSEISYGPKTDLSRLIVLHDDLDLAEGAVRIKMGGGDGGHKGVRSIADLLASREFIRVRLGIGRPPAEITAEQFVLSPFSSEQEEVRKSLVKTGLLAIRLILEQGLERAQNVLHGEKSP